MSTRSDREGDVRVDEVSHDLGGGGDLTFHLMKKSHQDNLELLDDNSNTSGNMKPGFLEPEAGNMKAEDDAQAIIEPSNEQEDLGDKATNKADGDGQIENEEVDKSNENSESRNKSSPDIEERSAGEGEDANGVDGKENSVQDGADNKEEKSSDENKIQKLKEGDLKEPRKLDRQQRTNAYNTACTLQQEGNIDKALKYLLAAITGLTENNSFHELPQCLHQVSNIYFEKNEFEKAVHFIQAEKMYYETALLDIVNLQKQVAEKQKKKEADAETSETSSENAQNTEKEETKMETKETNPEITKAREFENLARLCLKEGKPQLALEYCGKATKTYRSQLGDEHPTTVGSLDLFALIYADVGKKLYEDAMKKFGVDEDSDGNTGIKASTQQQTSTEARGSVNTSGIIRNRSKSEGNTHTKSNESRGGQHRQVHFQEEYEPSPPPEQDDWVTTVLLMVLFFLITVLCALIFSYFYCRNNERSEICAEFKGDLTYWYMKIVHSVKYYTSSGRR